MDAIQLLKADHKVVKSLLSDLEDSSHRAVKKRMQLLNDIQKQLKAHTTIEEEIFYPAFKAAGTKDEMKMYFEALEEHRAAEALVLPDLLATDPASDQFAGRAKVLKELIDHHIEEEEQEMFKDARKLLSAAELKTLGAQMESRKTELLNGIR
ncbi:hemerythrin HHE cation binding domain-containing protein [Luteibacter rhizovicinus]|uniref:Hemerythrin HHE cation binding domain-containing protein n=1 Tax=Luteibacter rhizovicinus TaxID=242606 RepID=A0A4R3Z1U7_9GAMM|nr:hemerythrin domain-containing protein [Luteibacter rhizovicinus]TCV97773.1 hemerythrin HHE cation binding domain-containing protein [Luteibacter rhizovicinus]